MSNTSKIFQRIPVEVQNRNGFDQSHEHIFTAKVGTLVPIMCKEIMPNTTIDLGIFAQAQLPPMATDFYGRVDLCFESFFVPMRQLFEGFETVLTHQTLDNTPGISYPSYMSYLPGASGVPVGSVGAGSLADYLGLKIKANSGNIDIANILPFVCYHWVWQEMYRDSRVMSPAFIQSGQYGGSQNGVSYIQHLAQSNAVSTPIVYPYGTRTNLSDSTSLFSLRQRCWAKDYFTNATLQPQQGSPSVLQFATSVTGTADSQGNVSGTGTGSFTIQSLMVANSLQKWLQVNNIAGNRFGDQQYAQFGIYPESYKCDRPIYLGSYRMGIYNKSVYTSSAEMDQQQYVGNNPFSGTPGTKHGSPMGVGDSQLVDKFHASEFGYLMVIASIVPHAVYATGTEKKFRRNRVGDFPFPLLENVGDQPIYHNEMGDTVAIYNSTSVFGYTQRFSDWKYELDKVSGLVRDGESLDSFVFKRSFNTIPVLGSSFLEIPQNALDEVAASSSTLPSSFGAWCDVFFKLKTVMPLAAYSIPTLGDLKDTHTVTVSSGGVRL